MDKNELLQLCDDEYISPRTKAERKKTINRENFKITFRHIIEAKLYCHGWTVNDDFFYDYLHQQLLNRWGLN